MRSYIEQWHQEKKIFQGFPSCFLETFKTRSWKEHKHVQLIISGYLESIVHGPSYYTGSKTFQCSLPKARGDGVLKGELLYASRGQCRCCTAPSNGRHPVRHKALCLCAALLLGRRWKKSPLAQKLNNCSQRRKNGCGGNWSPREPQKDGVHLKRWQEN